MIEVHAEFPQREVIQANAVVDNEEKTVSEVIISAKPEITGVTASVDNETGTPYVDVTETGTGIEYSFDLAFHNLKGDKGDKGETGQTGNGIASITKTSSVGLEDDYTINFTNGTQTVYTVTNGADGQDGTNGTDGQDGFSPIATVEPIQDGAKITITDKDGTTTTNVYNGTNGTDGTDGQAATVTVGTTTTGAAGTGASVVNSGTSSAAILDFTIPRGNTGATGVSVTGVSLISTQGLQKTYRMTFSNNTYYDYIVTDGASGSTAWGSISGTLSDQTDLQTELTGLQSQIDAIVSSSDVFDIVGTYAELQAYDISTVPVNDIIKVLVDSTHSNAATYYRCVETGGVKSWSYIGSEGAYYTKSETDTLLNDKYDVSNPAGYTSNVGTVTSVNNTQPDANGNVNISVTGGANTDLSNLTATGEAHFLKSIDSTDIINALGYTPQNSLTAVTHNANTQMGSGVNPVYVSSTGQVFSSGSTVGSGVKPVFLNAGAITVSASTVGNSTTPVYLSSGTITSTGLSIANTRFDGQWVFKYQNVSATNAVGSYSYSLSNYLPSGTYSTYELLLRLGISSNSTTHLWVGTSASPGTNQESCFILHAGTVSSSTRSWVSGMLPITTKNIYYQITDNKASGNIILVILGYRRIGTNT